MSYLPTTDKGLATWAKNLSDQLGAIADPTTIGITASDVTEYQTLTTEYLDRLEIAEEPETRGGANIRRKNETKKSLIALSGILGMSIARNANVTDDQRYAMWLPIVNTDRTPIGPPTEKPTIENVKVDGHRVSFRLHDATSDGRGKPENVTGAAIYTYVGETSPANLNDWHFEGTESKNEVHLDFNIELTPGTRVWFTAAWLNAKHETGDACDPVSTYLGGGVAKAA